MHDFYDDFEDDEQVDYEEKCRELFQAMFQALEDLPETGKYAPVRQRILDALNDAEATVKEWYDSGKIEE